jgi:replicative DNA helicase
MSSDPTKAHIPPQSIESEESVLGAMMLNTDSIDRILLEVRLKAEDFYRDRHRAVFGAITAIHERSDPVDVLTVTEEMTQLGTLEDAGGKDFVTSLASTVAVPGNAQRYAEIVKENSLLRRLLRAGQAIQQSVHDRAGLPRELVEAAEKSLFNVAHEELSADFKRISAVLDLELHRLEQLYQGDNRLTGTPSGFRDLDDLTGGFQPGNFVVIAARPAMGKSALIANIAENVALQSGRAVAMFSLEMSEAELAQRFIANRAKLRGDRLRVGDVTKSDWPKVVQAAGELHEIPLYIDDSSDISLLELRAKARRLASQEKTKAGLSLIMVDYLQLMRAEDGIRNRVEQVAQISRGLKILARELQVPVIGVSQLSRAPEIRKPSEPIPILSDLRESGQIEQDADLVIFIYRDEYYNNESDRVGEADLIVAKNRNGPTRTIPLAFLRQYPRFADLARREEPFIARRAGETEEIPETLAEGL